MKQNETEESVLTVVETARVLRLSRGAAYEAVKRGEIPSLRIGRRIIVPIAALNDLLRRSVSDDGHAARKE